MADSMIDPQLMAMLGSISSGSEDQSLLKEQMAIAEMMRQHMPGTQMAGRVAIKNSPLQYLGAGMSNLASNYQSDKTLQEMRDNASRLRSTRAAYMAEMAKQASGGQLSQAGASGPQAGAMTPEEQYLIQSQQQMQPGMSTST